jgi:hypothetical protein
LGGRPRRRLTGIGLTRCGARSFHWVSVRSLGYMVLS